MDTCKEFNDVFFQISHDRGLFCPVIKDRIRAATKSSATNFCWDFNWFVWTRELGAIIDKNL